MPQMVRNGMQHLQGASDYANDLLRFCKVAAVAVSATLNVHCKSCLISIRQRSLTCCIEKNWLVSRELLGSLPVRTIVSCVL